MKTGFHISASVAMQNSLKKTIAAAHHPAVILLAAHPAHPVAQHLAVTPLAAIHLPPAASMLHSMSGVFGLKAVYPLINRSL